MGRMNVALHLTISPFFTATTEPSTSPQNNRKKLWHFLAVTFLTVSVWQVFYSILQLAGLPNKSVPVSRYITDHGRFGGEQYGVCVCACVRLSVHVCVKCAYYVCLCVCLSKEMHQILRATMPLWHRSFFLPYFSSFPPYYPPLPLWK